AMLGAMPGRLLDGRTLHEIVHERPAAGWHCQADDCLLRQTLSESAGRAAMDDVFWTAADAPLLVEYTYAPMVDDDRVVGGVLTFKDVTARKALERKLEQATRISRLGRASATLAHEFNNVLMGI